MSDDLGKGLSRWSRRKLAARNGSALPEQASETDVAPLLSEQAPPNSAGQQANVSPTESPEPALDLPSIDDLTAESDYTRFLAKNVPESLRRAALRKLWTSDPVLANLDGLNDYDEDFNLVDQVISAAQTSYRPGQGYIEELEKLAQEDADAEPPAARTQIAADDARGSTAADELSQNDAPSNEVADAVQQSELDDEPEQGGSLQSGDSKKSNDTTG